jgi:hypothetical protein
MDYHKSCRQDRPHVSHRMEEAAATGAKQGESWVGREGKREDEREGRETVMGSQQRAEGRTFGSGISGN